MHSNQLRITHCGSELLVRLRRSPDYFGDDSQCNVHLQLQGEWRHAAFACYPEGSRQLASWTVPVEWTDGLILYVPSLSDESIAAALQFLLEGGHENETLIACDAPEVLPSFPALDSETLEKLAPEIRDSIRGKLVNIFAQLKQLHNAKSKSELRSWLEKHAADALQSIDT